MCTKKTFFSHCTQTGKVEGGSHFNLPSPFPFFPTQFTDRKSNPAMEGGKHCLHCVGREGGEVRGKVFGSRRRHMCECVVIANTGLLLFCFFFFFKKETLYGRANPFYVRGGREGWSSSRSSTIVAASLPFTCLEKSLLPVCALRLAWVGPIGKRRKGEPCLPF